MERVRALLQQVYAVALFCCVGWAASTYRDLEKELAFYGSYHQDWRNQIIHFIFVPLIWWSLLILHCYLPILGLDLTIPVIQHKVTWASLQFVVYVSYYCTLDTLGGGIFSIVMLMLYVLAYTIVQRELSAPNNNGAAAKPVSSSRWKIWHIAHILHALAWYMQLHPGHKVFEGVKPALVDSLVQSLAVAPLFAFYEGIWAAGLAPELQQQVIDHVAARRLQMCSVVPDLSFCS